MANLFRYALFLRATTWSFSSGEDPSTILRTIPPTAGSPCTTSNTAREHLTAFQKVVDLKANLIIRWLGDDFGRACDFGP